MDWSEVCQRIAEGTSDKTEFKRGLGDSGCAGREAPSRLRLLSCRNS